jgi:hypothetical protein
MTPKVLEPRTDEAFLKACKAYSELQDALDAVFWFHAWKLRTFGQSTLTRKHGQLVHCINKWGEALVGSALVDSNRKT